MRRPVLPQDEEVRKSWIDWYDVAKKTTIASGVFSLILFILLIYNHINLNRDDVLDSPVLISLKQQLRESPNDQSIKDIIRDTDASLRAQYFSRYHKQNSGGVLLTLTLTVFFLSLRIVWINKPLPPEPGPDPHKAAEHRRELRLGRRAVWGLVLVMCCTSLWLYMSVPHEAPGYVDPAAAEKPTGPVIPNWDALMAQWPSFRGQGGNARVELSKAPKKWSATENIRWHEKVSLDGLNSPVIWGDRLFLSGAIKTQRYVYCLNLKNGKTVWRKQVKDVDFSPEEHPHVEDFTGYAAPTVACDGNNVYAIFANGDFVAFNMDGELQWSHNVGIEGNMYGYSASLALYKDKVYVQVDQDEGSFVAAFDTLEGTAVWEKERDMGACWASPVVAKLKDSFQLLVMGPDAVSYDADSGEELWRHTLMSGDIAPTPITANDITYVVNMSNPLTAIDASGKILWKNTDGAWPDTSSPVTDGTYIWLIDSGGIMSCVSCADGKIIYEEMIEGRFTVSPTIVNDEVMFVSEEGKVTFIARSDKFEVKRQFDSGIPLKASPAFDAKGNMYLRNGKDVYCVKAQ